jgi:hypothetical protein
MFRLGLRSFCATQRGVFVALLCLMCSAAAGQEPQAINVNFAFPLRAIDNRFEHTSKSEVEKEVAAELAKICRNQLPFWTFRSSATGVPRLEVWLSQKNSTWSLNMTFEHPVGKNFKNRWSSVVYAPGDLDTQVLPKDKAWVSKVSTAFQALLQGESKNEGLEALKEFAPLGTQMANVPAQTGAAPPRANVPVNATTVLPLANVPAQATAVLPLEYGKYRALSLSNFRIMCKWNGHGVVVLHSTGTGAPMDFTPDAPKFKGIWVVLNKWDFGGNIEEVSIHVNDLPRLKPMAFFLEQINSAPPQISVAPQ